MAPWCIEGEPWPLPFKTGFDFKQIHAPVLKRYLEAPNVF